VNQSDITVSGSDSPDTGYRYYWYLKGTFGGGSEEAKSREADVDAKTYELTFTAITTTHEWTVNTESNTMKRIFGDTANAAFNAEGWFNTVQTPDTVAAPAAIALSSIVPADEASNIAVSSAIVLTFNNPIAGDAVSVISAGGDIVPVTKAYDAAKKILTITPNSNLTTNTTYIVAVAGVIDVYGQALAAVAKNFSTTA
jgi:hypothetical protein